jgi:hypothetical protein
LEIEFYSIAFDKEEKRFGPEYIEFIFHQTILYELPKNEKVYTDFSIQTPNLGR